VHRSTSDRFQAPIGGRGASQRRQTRRVLALAIGLLLFAGEFTGTARSAEVAARLRYALCRDNVAASEIALAGTRYGLSIRLKPYARRELAMLSRLNRGRTLEVVFADRVLLRTAFSSELAAGVFFMPVGGLDAAHVALAEFRQILREGPCGPLALPDTD
jgi:hypothetical protein